MKCKLLVAEDELIERKVLCRLHRAGSGPQDPGDGQELRHPLPDRI